jgi:hypothetical protein
MSDKSYEEEVEGIVLPEWLTASFPEHLPWSVVSYNDGKYYVSHDGSEFKDVVEAYDYASAFKEEYQVVLDSSLDGHGGELTNGFFFCDVEQGASSSRLLLSHTTQDSVTLLKHDYLTWLTKLSIEYSIDPDSFFNAHRWLTFHPVFWRKSRIRDDFRWDTSDGLRDVTVSLWWNQEENKPGICLEAGIHHAPEYTDYRRDDRLTSYASTYEEAIIILAKSVNELFDVDGVERQTTL